MLLPGAVTLGQPFWLGLLFFFGPIVFWWAMVFLLFGQRPDLWLMILSLTPASLLLEKGGGEGKEARCEIYLLESWQGNGISPDKPGEGRGAVLG